MLTQAQIEFTWEKLIAAETRVLYFGDLAAHYNGVKQVITGVSFFLASGAAATIIGGAPKWVPTTLATIVALATAYSIAVGLDRKITTAVKLHCGWHAVAADCNRLWNHTYEEDAEQSFDDIVKRELRTIRGAWTSGKSRSLGSIISSIREQNETPRKG